MAKIIVVTGLDQLPPAERWPRLIAPLAEELADSGLGELPDLEALRRDADRRSFLEATEVAVNLVHFGYGRQLVDRVVEAAGVKPQRRAVPTRWHDYGCADYFASELAERGYRDEAAQLLVYRAGGTDLRGARPRVPRDRRPRGGWDPVGLSARRIWGLGAPDRRRIHAAGRHGGGAVARLACGDHHSVAARSR
jgi:hypothetical protein